MPKTKKKSLTQKLKSKQQGMQQIRSDAQKRAAEQAVDTDRRRSQRVANKESAAAAQALDTKRRKSQRVNNPQKASAAQAVDTERRRSERLTNKESAATAQALDTERRKSQRVNNPQEAAAAQAVDTERRRSQRLTNKESAAAAQALDTERRKRQRVNNPPEAAAAQAVDTERRKRQRRENPEIAAAQQVTDTARRQRVRTYSKSTYEFNEANYREAIREAPTYVCSCCGRLMYKKSISAINMTTFRESHEDHVVAAALHVTPQNDEPYRLCLTCKKSIGANKIPRLALCNGFDFPHNSVIPEELKDLRPLEERLVSLRLPFLQIRAVGCDRQSLLKGNVVNVENDLDTTTNVIPRRFEKTETVQVMLMRRMNDKRPYQYEFVRPFKVLQAAKYLMGTELYQNEGIILDKHLDNYRENDRLEFVLETNEDRVDQNEDTDDEIEEPGERELNITAEETLIFNDATGIRIAPGEGKKPIPLYKDKTAEELSFPTIYCGVKRNFEPRLRVTYTDIVKSELTRYDRRAVKPAHLFFAYCKSRNEKIGQAMQVCLRKTNKHGGRRMTVEQAMDPANIDSLIKSDLGYNNFKNIRGSPQFMQDKTKKVLAMIRQLGKPSLFVTLSAAETQWPELLVNLTKVLKNETITEEEATLLSFEEKAYLIRSDPVSCMRFFNYRMDELYKHLLKTDHGVYEPYMLTDYFARLEFQMRGSPHSHKLHWLTKDGNPAPIYEEGNPEKEAEVIAFIDEHITCLRDEEGEMEKLLTYQLHKCTATCHKKRSNRKCRFGFPRPPMPCTKILLPLSDATDAEKKEFQNTYKKIEEKMDTFSRSYKIDHPFDDFLTSLELTSEQYEKAIRSTLKTTTVFLKRSTNACFINNYNKKLLLAWRANMDIQYVIDMFACAKYVASYMMKAEAGISKVLQAIERDAKRGNISVKEKLQRTVRALIYGTEVSAQEAAAYLLGIDYTKCSRSDVYVNTALPEERIGILKPLEDLQDLVVNGEGESLDIIQKNIIDHYSQRPDELDDVCLAAFASEYQYHSNPKRRVNQNQNELEEETKLQRDEDEEPSELIDTPEPNPLNEPLTESNVQLSTPVRRGRRMAERFVLKCGSGYVTKRGVRKIIRFRHYALNSEPDEYFREMLMLFLPWRDEENELLNENCRVKYQQNLATIERNANTKFFAGDMNNDRTKEMMQEILESIEENNNEEETITVENDEGFIEDEEQIPWNPINAGEGDEAAPRIQTFVPENLISEEAYLKIMRNLNGKQRQLVLTVLQNLKSGLVFKLFLSGAAGVGKSFVITAILQSIQRFLNSTGAIDNPECVSVVIAAPTGKAAFNVGGNTLHSAFRLPPNQSKEPLRPMDASTLNTYRVRYASVKLFIIDEMSMVSTKQLYDIDFRLRQIFATNEPFGGKSVIFMGHLRQLRPIGGRYIFMTPDHIPLAPALGNYLWQLFHFFELTEIMRQAGDYAFCKALNNMAEGCMDDEDIALIRTREITLKSEAPENAIFLFSNNEQCKIHNAEVHKRLTGLEVTSIAHDTVQGTRSKEQLENLLTDLSDLPFQKTDGIPYSTNLKVGGEYFVSHNIDVSDGLFNGATGCIMDIDLVDIGGGRKVAKTVWVDFRNDLVGARARERFLASRGNPRFRENKEKIEKKWTPIQRISVKLTKKFGPDVEVNRKQIALVAANGMTIHKAQGTTLLLIVLSVLMLTRKLSREEWYVACSRATSSQGLFILGKFQPPSAPSSNDPITRAVNDIKENRPFPTIQLLSEINLPSLTIYYHNVRSLVRHFEDVNNDHFALGSNVLAFLEPNLLQTDNINFPGYECAHITKCSSRANSEGVALFTKGAECSNINYHAVSKPGELKGHCLFLTSDIHGVRVVITYKHPAFPIPHYNKELRSVLEKCQQQQTIILGDTNIDMISAGNSTKTILTEFSYQSALPENAYTTDRKTQIDICFTNNTNLTEAWLGESYYSDHKPICVVLKSQE